MHNPGGKFKEAAYSQFLRKGIWMAPDGIEYMGNSIRTAQYRYTEWYNWETGTLAANELYDRQSDPDENTNIADDPDNQQVINHLREKLHAVLSVTKK
jgi:iduronate 2-sulfatase